eukprot:9617299-Alexandrium_andersonii.AAC.1
MLHFATRVVLWGASHVRTMLQRRKSALASCLGGCAVAASLTCATISGLGPCGGLRVPCSLCAY